MYMSDLTSLGLRLRHARRERGNMSQAALAKAAGIKQPSVSELESGETKEISGPTLIAIAGALKVRPEWLVNGKGAMNEDEFGNLAQDERELLTNYRAALPRWKVSIRFMARLKGDAEQDEAAESMNVVLAKVSATPVADERLGPGWTRPDRRTPSAVQQPPPPPYKKPKK